MLFFVSDVLVFVGIVVGACGGGSEWLLAKNLQQSGSHRSDTAVVSPSVFAAIYLFICQST